MHEGRSLHGGVMTRFDVFAERRHARAFVLVLLEAGITSRKKVVNAGDGLVMGRRRRHALALDSTSSDWADYPIPAQTQRGIDDGQRVDGAR